tara:strand:- start:338 stop:1702 length:1365 start_codon:yes stop_codon:yes gene_type:complete
MYKPYKQAVTKLLTLANFESTTKTNIKSDFHLERITRLLKYIGDPHKSISSIHVAGTKGKGSTCVMISSALISCGYQVGFFSSPSIHKITERIALNNRPISENDFTEKINELWPAVVKIADEGDIGSITVFEMLTAMSLHYFKKQSVDFAVMEVGLGGRLDSTNVIHPLLSVITPISIDHVDVLGKTIESIALEKAGIIKKGVPTVLSDQLPVVRKVISRYAKKHKSPIYNSTDIVKITDQKNLKRSGSSFLFLSNERKLKCIVPLVGPHQVDNARTALASLAKLSEMGIKIPLEKATEGISKLKWPARGQVIRKNKLEIFADGAHNKASGIALLKTLKLLYKNITNPILIYGSGYGHDSSEVINEILPINPIIVLTRSRHPKSIPVEELETELLRLKIPIYATTKNTKLAVALAKKLRTNDSIIIATGSLFIAGEVIEIMNNIKPELYQFTKN